MVGTRAISGSRRGNGYTGRLSFARYALDSIVRNRRRTLYAVLGITLAVSLIAGSLIAVDSASIGLIRERLEDVPADFTGLSYSYLSYVDEARYERVTDNLLEVEGVEHAICVVGFQGWAFFNSEGDLYEAYDYYYYYGSGTLLMVPDDPSILIERYQIYGDAPAPGTVAVPQDIASSLDIEPGDEIICGYETYEYDYVNDTGYLSYYNVSFEVSQIWGQSDEVEAAPSNWYWYEDTPGDVTISGHRNPIVMYSDDFVSAVETLPEQQSPGLSEEYIVWIDRDDYLRLANIPSTLESLETLSGRLDRAAHEANVDFYTPLANVLSQMGGDQTAKKVVFIALSLPVVVMGIYLSLVGVEMGMTERRRELGVLKSRGAGNGQVLASLVSESVVLGVLSSLLGLALGLALSRFLVVAVSGMLSTGLDDPSLATFYVSWRTVATVVVFGTFLMLLSSYRPMKRAARMPVAEALHHYTPKTVQVRYKARYDIAALALSLWSIASVFWLYKWIPEWNLESWLVYFVIELLVLFGWVLVPAVPFLLSVSVIRLVTRGSRRLYTRFSRLVKSWTKELHYIVEKNIARNPKRASNIGIIVSLAVAFGLFVSVTMESELAYVERTVLYEVGADLNFYGWPAYSWTGTQEVDYDALSSVETVDGVEQATVFIFVSARVDYSYGTMAVFDSDELTETVDIGRGWYVGDGSDDIRDLKENGTAFVSESFAEDNYLIIGDSVPVVMDLTTVDANYSGETTHFWLDIIGFVSQLPGVRSDVYVDSDTLSFIEPEWFPEYYIQIGVLASVEDGASHYDTAESLQVFCRDANVDGYVTIAQERLDETASTPEFRSVREFLYLEYALSLVMLTCGVGLVLFVTVWDRRQELACIMARGSSPGQMRRILMGESVSLMALGMVVGVSTGMISAVLYNSLVHGIGSPEVPHDTVFSWVSGVVVLSAIGSFVLASYLATYRVGKLKLAEILRIRGG